MKLLELPGFFNIVCDCGDWFIYPSWVLFAFRRPCWAECYHGRVLPNSFPRRGKACSSGIPFSSSNERFMDLFCSTYCSPFFLKCSFVLWS